MGNANERGRIETEEQYEQRLSRYYRRLAADKKAVKKDRDLPKFTNKELTLFIDELKMLVRSHEAMRGAKAA